MTEYIDKTEAMRRFKPFGREIPKEQVMAVLARIDEGIVRCKDCRHHDDFFVGAEGSLLCWKGGTDRVVSAMGYCECGERSEE